MATTKWKGLTDGVTCEWTLVAKVKPGQEQALRQFAEARAKQTRESKSEEDVIIPVGTVHDYRWVLLENGTRIMFMSNHDGDWGAYIDDFFATGSSGRASTASFLIARATQAAVPPSTPKRNICRRTHRKR